MIEQLKKTHCILLKVGHKDPRVAAVNVVGKIMGLAEGSCLKLKSLFVTFARTVGSIESVGEFFGYLEGLEGEKHGE